MVDEPVITAAPAPVSTPAPVVAPAPAPAAAPAVDAAAAAAPVVAPAADAASLAPAEGAKPADAVVDALKPHAAADEPTLLETIGKKDGEKPADGVIPLESDVKPPEAPKKFDFQPFQAPEGVKLDDARVSVLNDVIGEGLGPQETRDKLIGMHIDEMKNYDTALRQQQQDTFRDTRKDWLGKIKADPELGGSGFETTKTNVAEMRDLFASHHKSQSEGYIQDMAEFNHMLRYTGVGDHPAFWRFLNNVARKFKEPATPLTDIKPPPDMGRAPKGGKRGSLYDHPTSHNNRR